MGRWEICGLRPGIKSVVVQKISAHRASPNRKHHVHGEARHYANEKIIGNRAAREAVSPSTQDRLLTTTNTL